MRALITAFLVMAIGAGVALQPPYMNPALPVPERVADLVSRMSLDELIAAVAHKDAGNEAASILAQYGNTSLGGVKVTLFQGASAKTALESVRERNAFQAKMMASSRLNIPVSVAQEGLHSGSAYGTIFPEPLLLGCTWNDTLALLIGQVLAVEARASGVDNTWSPVLNMWQDDRFGRFQEGLSPDPAVTSHMGRAIVTGIQGGPSNQDDYLPDFNVTAWATAKHYAGYGSAVGGLNAAPFKLNNRTLFEQFLRPWRAAAATGVRGVMASHNTVLDVPMHHNKWLLGVLRQEFGFGNGMIISDCNDIGAAIYFNTANNLTHVSALSIKAGLDVDLQCGYTNTTASYIEHIPAALSAGLINLTDLQLLAGRYLTQKFAAGLFDQPMTDESLVDNLNAPAHRQLAYEAAAQGLVLLQNEKNILPLSFGNKYKKVALIGDLLSCRECLLGSYVLDNNIVEVDLLPTAFNKTFYGAVEFTVTEGASPDSNSLTGIAQAVTNAQNADVAIVLAGDSLNTCGEWLDRDSLDLPGAQLDLLQALVTQAPKTPIVLVLVNGRAATFGPGNALMSSMAAIVETWRPGEMGAQVIVDVLSGKINPSGKLSSSWAQNVGQLGSGAQPFLAKRVAKWIANARSAPDPTDGRVYDPYVATGYSSLPLFRFGHGLSYTTYEYQSLVLDGVASIASLPGDGTFSGRGRQGYVDALAAVVFTAHVSVCNRGAVAGTEVVQVYVQDPKAAFPTPVVPYWKRLVGYGRIPLSAGQCATLSVPICADDFALYDDLMVLRVVAGEYIITAGGRSDRDTLSQTLLLA